MYGRCSDPQHHLAQCRGAGAWVEQREGWWFGGGLKNEMQCRGFTALLTTGGLSEVADTFANPTFKDSLRRAFLKVHPPRPGVTLLPVCCGCWAEARGHP